MGPGPPALPGLGPTLVLVRPETVVRWHRQAWHLCWHWKSRSRLGGPRLSAEARELIAVMSRDNPCRGTERLRGKLLKPGIAFSNGSIRRYRGTQPPRPLSQSWRTFLANHAGEMWGGKRRGGAVMVHPPGMYEFLVLLLGVIRAGVRSRADLLAENLLLRHQPTVLARPTRKRPPLRGRDKLLWVLARRLCAPWGGHLVLVRPETVVRWHRQAWRLFRWWQSRRPVGRPRLSA